jgi:uncharacterized protein (TIGR03435 family)
MIAYARLGVGLFSVWSLFGQSPPGPPAFEVSVIKLNKSGLIREDYFTVLPGGKFVAHNARLSDLFLFAFKLRRDAVSGTPGWFDSDRFDITAKAGVKTPTDTLRLMLQTLLTQEFKIAFHKEQKNMSAFVLVVAKSGPKLKTASGSGAADCKRVGNLGTQFGGSHLECTDMKISELADGLPDLAPGYINKPVIDGTGLTGPYDFQLEWIGNKSVDELGGPTIFDAVEKLGLRFEDKKLPLPTIVIDHMEKLTEN